MMSRDAGIRLNKFISETGICSRREADRLIDEGRVQVNGRAAEMGMRVAATDRVTVAGKPLRARPQAVYLAYNKPVGITCTTDPAVPENIIDAVRYRQRIFPIGRLDKASEGLILLTNDGDIVNKILRAGNAHEKEYVVSVDRPFDSAFLQRMAAGVPVLGTVTQPCRIRPLTADSFNITLTQGLNRQIRRMTEYLGYRVTRLKRVRVMNVRLERLKPGHWRELSQTEVTAIDQMIASSSKTEEASLENRAQPMPSPKKGKKGSGSQDGHRRTKTTGKTAGQGKGRGRSGGKGTGARHPLNKGPGRNSTRRG